MNYKATNPDRIFDKVRESQYFLVLMVDHEKALDTEKFLFCLSAFLSAFRTAIFRLYGVIEYQHGQAARKALKNSVENTTDVSFLKNATDLEVHGDGVIVRQRYSVDNMPVAASVSGRLRSKFDMNRFGPSFESRYHKAPRAPQAVIGSSQPVDWQFEERPGNLIALCHDALNQLEEIVKQAIMADPGLASDPPMAPNH